MLQGHGRLPEVRRLPGGRPLQGPVPGARHNPLFPYRTHRLLPGTGRFPGDHGATTPGDREPERCVDCGLCLEECPAASQGAGGQDHGHPKSPRVMRGAEHRLYFRTAPAGCASRSARPPPGPSSWTGRPGPWRLRPERWWWPPDTSRRTPDAGPSHGYGRLANVITGLELEERRRRTGVGLLRPDGRLAQSIAFIQCVGSRDLGTAPTAPRSAAPIP